ncbi:hypothetical protein D1BOALGB6SA_10886 [Olavius sp. associated proteobacterium Delta 1]|nr:hypothetical protein D1BOALGB6SA_10886 [Olavius sp. associated proteobacterium Delta 1]
MTSILLILIVLIIVLFVKLSRLRKYLSWRLDSLEQAVSNLKQRIRNIETSFRAASEEETAEAQADTQKATEPAGAEITTPQELIDEKKIEPDPVTVAQKPPPLPVSRPAPVTAEPAEEKSIKVTPKPGPRRQSEWSRQWQKFRENVDWEQFTGIKLFAWLGGIALFIGAGFFVKYTIDRNLIPPEMRLAIGALVGLGLIISSGRLRRVRYDITRQTLAAGGIGVLYTVIFAATLYYHFLPELVGFILLTVVSAAAFVLALYHRGIAVSVLGALGAYATPILIDPGQGSLVMLFVYLTIVNAGLYQVIRRLNSSILLLIATIGTLVSLTFGSLMGGRMVPSFTIAWVWIANLVLFTVIIDLTKLRPDRSAAVSWTGNILYLAVILLSLVLLPQRNETSLLLCTAGAVGAIILAMRNPGWHQRVIPYAVITFSVAMIWVLVSFQPRMVSWGLLLFLLYGVFAGCGPVFLIQKYGLQKSFLYWFRVFPLAIAGLSLAAVFKQPNVTFWFWPMSLGLQVLGIGISLLFGAVVQVAALVLIFVISGLTWILRVPSELIGPGFYGFLLFAGAVLCMAVFFVIRKLPAWIGSLKLDKKLVDPNMSNPRLIEWMTATPAVGGFLLLAASFMIQKHLDPHPGMVTMICFLGLTLFLCKRLSFQPLGIVALLAAVFTEGIWMLAPIDSVLHHAALQWAGPLFAVALIMPFAYFRSPQTWNRVWMAWALFEVFQGLFIIWAGDCLWPREFSGWLPMILFLLKLPCVAVMLKRLQGKPEKNAIIAFHGGALLFYISAIPVLLLDYGWIGLTLVCEASALLWLNRRVAHPGLRWVAAFMAPAGLMLLFAFLPQMKNPPSLVIFNAAVLSLAAAIVLLAAAVKLSGFPERLLRKMDLPNFFLWLVLGTGFGLLNLVIADIFAGPATSFRFLPGNNQLQAVCYFLVWAAFGSILWKIRVLTGAMRQVGLNLLLLATAGMILFPFIYPHAVPAMRPLFNLGLVAYLPLMIVLLVLFLTEPERENSASVKNLFLVMLLVVSFLFIKLEKGTFLQPGQTFTLFKSHTLSMAAASAVGWLAYGLGLLMWPRRLDRYFRLAGFGLILLGLGKAVILPFRFKVEFAAITPILNTPTLVYLIILGVMTALALKKTHENWPLPGLNRQAFWSILLAVMSFFVMNIQIASAFGVPGRHFSLLTHGSLAHQLGYSLSWLVYASGLLVVGINLAQVRVRWAALFLLVITSLKIFLMDLWKLGQLYRVASLVGLAFVLILVSFLYQRFLTHEDDDATKNSDRYTAASPGFRIF